MTATVVAIGWILGWLLLWRVPRLRSSGGHGAAAAPGAGAGVRTAVIVPARNEADRLPLLLGDLVRQTCVPERVLVVDDQSTDGTGDVARRCPGVDVIEAPERPPGWTGKSWACEVGAEHLAAAVDLLVFLDADVRLGPDALARVLATWRAEGGLVSVQPRHDVATWPEALSLVFNVVAVMGLGIASLWPPRREWGAAGPCLAISTTDHRRVGGHAAVASEVAEDLALARRCRERGVAVRCVVGGDEVRFRMYRDWRGVLEGWTKNIATGAARTPLLRAACIAVWVAALLSVAARLVVLPWAGAGAAVATVALYTVVTLQVAVLGRSVGRFGAAALAWPVLVAFFVAVIARSAFRTVLTGRVDWSGRVVTVGRSQGTGRWSVADVLDPSTVAAGQHPVEPAPVVALHDDERRVEQHAERHHPGGDRGPAPDQVDRRGGQDRPVDALGPDGVPAEALDPLPGQGTDVSHRSALTEQPAGLGDPVLPRSDAERSLPELPVPLPTSKGGHRARP